MRVGFAISLPEQLERLAPVARRIDGARWIVPAGRWPSAWLDSRQWTRDALVRECLAAPAEANADLDLVVLPGGIPPHAVDPWLHSDGCVVPFHDERPNHLSRAALRLGIGAAWAPAGSDGAEFACVGDPRIDKAVDTATRARARAALGLESDARRGCIVLRPERGDTSLRRLAEGFARLRGEVDLVIAPSAEGWLRSSHPVPVALHGPGVSIVRDRLGWAELLALADVVVAEPGKFVLDALALGKAVLLMGVEPPRVGRMRLPDSWPSNRLWHELPSVHEASDVSARLDAAVSDRIDVRQALASELDSLCGPLDGSASRRAVAAIRTRTGEVAILRALTEMERSTTWR